MRPTLAQSNTALPGPDITVLTGPAGSGKTHRCLQEIRTRILADPWGPPLLFLVPRQATFQIERALLEPGAAGLRGYSRLQVASFSRLAEWILEHLGTRPNELLPEAGRVMVLRALLQQGAASLPWLGRCVRRPGLAAEVSEILREFRHAGLNASSLTKLAAQTSPAHELLRGKLLDLARIATDYEAWLDREKLEDGDHLLERAAEQLRQASRLASTTTVASPVQFEAVWLDGFADFSAPELKLLAAIVASSRQATLAFCLPTPPRDNLPPLSLWSGVNQSVRRCLAHLSSIDGVQWHHETLARNPATSRFHQSPVLARLEATWAEPAPSNEPTSSAEPEPPADVRILSCPDPDAEATAAARTIIVGIREQGLRYRDQAVLVRNLASHQDALRRTFSRYRIPFFIDQRESIAHHPLAELIRSSLRCVANGWLLPDLCAAWKTGLFPLDTITIDRIENLALERGWSGRFWMQPWEPRDASDATLAEEMATRWKPVLLRPLVEWAAALGLTISPGTPAAGDSRVSGQQWADACRTLLHTLRIGDTLQGWSDAGEPLHATAWKEVSTWLETVALGFGHSAMTLREWIPVVDAGLSGLTVGLVPPALDQVLIGSVDRARSPDLQRVILLGLNDGLFPQHATQTGLLAESERRQLEIQQPQLGPRITRGIARERFLGYIASTRARTQLILTFARQDADGRPLEPSAFLSHIRNRVPGLQIEQLHAETFPPSVVHPWELEWRETVLQAAYTTAGPSTPWLGGLGPRCDDQLHPEIATRLYGTIFHTSASDIEQFAQCPFRFFATSGLRARERKEFEVDPRETGSLIHEILARLHARVSASGTATLWRQIPESIALDWVREIGAELQRDHARGLFASSAEAATRANLQTEAALSLVRRLWQAWPTYQFNPIAVELAFGGRDPNALPAWTIDLGDGHSLEFTGRIDRIDLQPDPDDPHTGLAVVMDYKSSRRTFDREGCWAGLQLQLPAYLAALSSVPEAAARFGFSRLQPAGAFYVDLSTRPPAAKSRPDPASTPNPPQPHGHLGRFDRSHIDSFDSAWQTQYSGPFRFRLKRDGTFNDQVRDPQPPEAFSNLVTHAKQVLIRLAKEVLQGVVAVDPIARGKTTACTHCKCQSVCRIDPEIHRYRPLPPVPETVPWT